MTRKNRHLLTLAILLSVFLGMLPLAAMAAETGIFSQGFTAPPAPTGDEGHLFLFIGLAVVGAIGIAISIRILTKNRKR